MNYSGKGPTIDPVNLPACPAPSPQKPSSEPILPLNDPAAKHCYIDPTVAGEVDQRGVPSTQHSLPYFYAGDGRPATAPVAPHSGYTPAGSTNSGPVAPLSLVQTELDANGILDQQSNLKVGGIAATLYAQQPAYNGNAEVANWIGVQNQPNGSAKEFIQVGILSSTLGNCGTGNGGGNTAPQVFFEVEVNGSYQPILCLSKYIFGVGTQTFFYINWWGPNSAWYAWINWNNVWEEVAALGPESALVPGQAFATEQPAEVPLFGGQHPQIGTIADRNGQIYATNDFVTYIWEPWYTYVNPTLTVQHGPYCVTFPIRFSEVSVRSC